MRSSVATALSSLRRRPGRALVASGLFLAVVAAPLAFSPELYDNFTLPKQACLLFAAGAVLLGCAIERRFLPEHRVLRIAFLAWLATVGLSWALGIDPLGSVLGYYQYRQGLLTQISYAVLFAGAMQAAPWLPVRAVLAAGIAGLLGAAAYAGIQVSGNDPFSWWIDTSARAISTVGNANELAAYAVIALAFAGAGFGLRDRLGVGVQAIVAAAAGFVVFASESRSGLLALAIVVLAFPLAGLAVRWRRKHILLRTSVLSAGLLAGFLCAAAVGNASSAAGRVRTGLEQSDPTGSTRMQLWRGTLATIEASPLWGFGPDGLYKAFPRHRPADLEGAFEDYDLIAQSSHNLALDTAANTGLAGLAALAALVGAALIVSARGARRAPPERPGIEPYVWSAVAGYLALTLVNPLSLAPHAIFFILIGLLAGRYLPEPGATRAPLAPSPVRIALAAPAALALVAIAVLLPLADRAGQQAWSDYATGNFESAARHAADARRLMPIEQAYTRREGTSWLAAGATGSRADLLRAESTFERIDRRFGMTSSDAIALATAQIGLHKPTETINRTIDRILELNPYGVSLDWYTARLRRAALGGAVLRYQPKDRWVMVDTNGEVALP